MDGGLSLVPGRVAEFTVYGEPRGKERPQGRIITPKNGGKPFIAFHTGSQTSSYERLIYQYTLPCRRKVGVIEGPVNVKILIFMPIRPSYTKTRLRLIRNGLEACTSKPDIDNVVKAVLDGLVWSEGSGKHRQHVGLLKDDAQVVQLTVLKDYSDDPRVVVRVTELVAPQGLAPTADLPRSQHDNDETHHDTAPLFGEDDRAGADPGPARGSSRAE
jgi:Holliday junction resolvase RusA-like endonuclease